MEQIENLKNLNAMLARMSKAMDRSNKGLLQGIDHYESADIRVEVAALLPSRIAGICARLMAIPGPLAIQ